MKQAVIALFGKQYLVSEGETISVPVPKACEATFTVPVLTVKSGDALEIGNPYVPNAHARLRAGKPFRGKKVIVEIYKAKSHYHRKKGYRPTIAKVTIEKIMTNLPQ